MSSHEDVLRDLLRESADEVVPAGDGLTRIQARLARRRRLRWTLLPGAALVAAGATVAVLALGGSTPTNTLTVEPGGPSTTATPPVAPTGYDGPAIWPFPSDAVGEWRRNRPWAGESRAVAEHFLTDFLGLTRRTLEDAGIPGDWQLRDGGRYVALIHTEQRATGAWTVTQVSTPQSRQALSDPYGGELTSPAFGASVGSPLQVEGSFAQGADESVRVRLLTSDGKELATTAVPAGQGPWSGTLTWTDDRWETGVVVASTESAKGDGSLTRLFATPVRRGAAPASSSGSFAVTRSGHVELLFPGGAPSRQLTYPPAGATDLDLAYAAGRLAWVRSRSECDADLLQLVDGKASTILSKTSGLRSPRLSPDGTVLVWVEQDCGDGPDQVVVQVADVRRAQTGPEGQTVTLLDVTDDGALLVRLSSADDPDGRVVYVPPDGGLEQGVELLAGVSCLHHGAATFTGSAPGVWEDCKGRSRYVTYTTTGEMRDSGPLVDATSVVSAAEQGGRQVLLVGNRSGGKDVALYADGKLTYLSSCGSGGDCSTAADW